MEQQTRKRRVGIVTPPNVRQLNNCTPSPKAKRSKRTYSSPITNTQSWDEDDVFVFLEENGHENTGRILRGLSIVILRNRMQNIVGNIFCFVNMNVEQRVTEVTLCVLSKDKSGGKIK